MSDRSAAAPRPLRIALIAGEESGDRLGAALIAALRARHAGPLHFFGTGGSAMAAAGMPSLFPIDALSIMGFTAIPRRLPEILRRIGEAADAVIAGRPDVLVIIDSPDFTHRVARRVRRAAPQIPIVDYVSPSVWAWRPGRARAMRHYVDLVLALLPFEPAAHRQLGGPDCVFVGHPLVDEIADLRPDAAEVARRDQDPPLVVVLPGSRRGEIERHMPIFGAAIARLVASHGPVELCLPTVPHLAGEVGRLAATWPIKPRLAIDPAERRAAFRMARAALAKSGTVTLELALAGVPMVTAYKMPALEMLIIRWMTRNSQPAATVRSAILANLVLAEWAVPEFLQQDCVPEKLAEALRAVMADGAVRAAQLAAFARLDSIMEIGAVSPAGRAAGAVLQLLSTRY